MESSKRSLAALAAMVTSALTAASAVQAAEASYGAYAGMGYTDNVERASAGERSESIALVGGQLGIDHVSRRLTADVVTRLEYRDYLDDTYDSEVAGNFAGNAVLDIIEERFTWTLEDNFGQSVQNQFEPSTPDNTENVNYLTTGPDFTLPLGSRNRLGLHGRYVDVHYEDSDLGNERLRGEVALLRELSDVSTASINVNSEEVTYNDLQFADYDHREAYLNYEVNAARTTLSIDAGVTEIESGGQTDDGWLGRLNLARHVSEALTVGLELGHDFSDAGTWFAEMQAGQPGSLDPVPVQQTPNPFENNYGSIYGSFSRNRTAMNLRAAYYDEQYDVQPQFDRTRTTLDLSVSRDLNAAISARFGANYSRQQYDSLDQDFSDLTASLGLRWNLGRVTMLSVDYLYRRRNDDASGDYRSNELWLRLAYMVGEDVSSRSYGGM